MSDLPDVLQVTQLGEGRFEVVQPAESAEGRDVVFSGQYIAQMLMAAEATETGGKTPRSIHTLFARTGTYTKPIELQVDVMHSGRTWGSDSITATQDGKLLCRGLVLLNSEDPDLIVHESRMPAGLPGPDQLESEPALVFPGVEWRRIPDVTEVDGVPVLYAWHRFDQPVSTPAANQGIIAWSTCGHLIGIGFAAHPGAVDIHQAHRTLSTGVIGQTIHFFHPFDVSQWLLVTQVANKAAGGRIYGQGQVFTQDGQLVAEFHQDAMGKSVEGELDFRRAM
jgi:acyl-CoA thioesterase